MTTELPPTPSTVPKKKSRFQGLLKSRFLVISILFHVLLLVVATLLVVQSFTEREKTFKSGPKGSNPARNIEHNVKVKQKNTSAPQTQRITTTGQSKIVLPDLPAMSSTSFAPTSMPGMTADMLGGAQMGGGGNGAGKAINFFGLKAQSRSVIFIIDITGSLVMPPKSEKTWDQLEKEATKAINMLTPDTKFNVITFGPEAHGFKNSSVLATADNKKSAIAFLKSWSPVFALDRGGNGGRPLPQWTAPDGKKHGGTVPSNAFKLAFKDKPETILFLSDGLPTSGDTPANVLELIKKLQGTQPKKVPISVVAYYADAGREFMQDMAKQNGGQFRELK